MSDNDTNKMSVLLIPKADTKRVVVTNLTEVKLQLNTWYEKITGTVYIIINSEKL